MENSTIITHPIIKQLGKEIRYKSIIDYGRSSVVLDLGETKTLGGDPIPHRVYKILSMQHNTDESNKFACIKARLKSQGVHVVLSDNFESVPYKEAIENNMVSDALHNDLISFTDPACDEPKKWNKMVMFDEEIAPGRFLDPGNLDDYTLLTTIDETVYEKLFDDAYQCLKNGLYVDSYGKNILYTPDTGFWLIDLEYTICDKTQDLLGIITHYLKIDVNSIMWNIKVFEDNICDAAGKKDALHISETLIKMNERIKYWNKVVSMMQTIATKYSLRSLQKQLTNLCKKVDIATIVYNHYNDQYKTKHSKNSQIEIISQEEENNL